MAETAIIDAWITATLTSDSTLGDLLAPRPGVTVPGIYSDIAAQGAGFPHIVFQAVDPGQDVMVAGGIRVMVTAIYLVRGVVQDSSYSSLLAIANRIDALLHQKTATLAGGGSIVSSTRRGPYRLPEVINGMQYRHLGGLYTISAQE